jgi:hypothetical protein
MTEGDFGCSLTVWDESQDLVGTGWHGRGHRWRSWSRLVTQRRPRPNRPGTRSPNSSIAWTRREPSSATVREASGSPPTRTGWPSGSSGKMFLGMLVGLGFGTGLGVVVGAGLGVVIAKVDRSGIDRKFQGRVRGMLKPGTSTLVVLVNKGITDTVAEASAAMGAPSWSPPCPWMPSGGSRRPYGGGSPDKRQPVGDSLQHGCSGGCLALTPVAAMVSCPHAATH